MQGTITVQAPPHVITVLQPNGGEVWYVGMNQILSWSSVGVDSHVMIELNRAYPSGPWETLFPDVANTGSQLWAVSAPISDSSRIRITSLDANATSDVSDTSFSIHVLGSPQGLTVMPQGDDAVLAWQAVPGADVYNVYRSTDASLPDFPDIVGSTATTTLTDVGIFVTSLRAFYLVRAVKASGAPNVAQR
jgi:hypothetical protein